MHQDNKHINYRGILWALIILLLPFDSSPLAPGGVIRPLSIYPALVYFFIFFKLPLSFKMKRTNFKILIFAISILLYTLFLNVIYFHTVLGFLKFLYNVVFISIYSFVALNYLNYYTEDNSISQFWKHFTKLWIIASIFPCFLGLLQFIFIIFLNRGIIDFITSLFVYKTTGRIQLTFGEQTFSVIYLLISSVLIYFFFSPKIKKNILLTTYAFLFLASASTFGFITLIISLIIYTLVFRRSAFFKMALIGAFLILFIVSIFQYLPIYTQNRLLAIQEIAKNYTIFFSVASNDDSIFLRIVNPLIAFISLKYTHFLGTGGDSFGYIYPKILLDLFPSVSDNPQIKPIVEGTIRITPKNMYAKILAEFGIIIGGYIIYQLYRFIKPIKGQKPFEIIAVFILAIWLQFDAYFYPIFVILIISIGYTIKRQNIERQV